MWISFHKWKVIQFSFNRITGMICCPSPLPPFHWHFISTSFITDHTDISLAQVLYNWPYPVFHWTGTSFCKKQLTPIKPNSLAVCPSWRTGEMFWSGTRRKSKNAWAKWDERKGSFSRTSFVKRISSSRLFVQLCGPFLALCTRSQMLQPKGCPEKSGMWVTWWESLTTVFPSWTAFWRMGLDYRCCFPRPLWRPSVGRWGSSKHLFTASFFQPQP